MTLLEIILGKVDADVSGGLFSVYVDTAHADDASSSSSDDDDDDDNDSSKGRATKKKKKTALTAAALDVRAGEWPPALAELLVALARGCTAMYPQRHKTMAVVLRVLKAAEAEFCALTTDEVQRRMMLAEEQQQELVCVSFSRRTFVWSPAPCLALPSNLATACIETELHGSPVSRCVASRAPRRRLSCVPRSQAREARRAARAACGGAACHRREQGEPAHVLHLRGRRGPSNPRGGVWWWRRRRR
jgi:hypothetical protein